MSKLTHKIWKNRWILRALIPSIYFNFKHLPFRQAVHLPILIYKPHFCSDSGKIIIEGKPSFAMIRLGVNIVMLYPNNGIVFENRGTIVFKGKAKIGNNSAISVGPEGHIIFGNEFNATTHLQLISYHKVTFEDNVLIGWNTLITDSDFHSLTDINTGKKNKAYGPIYVGRNVWIANGCKLYKNAMIPDNCVLGADSILHSPIVCSPYSTIITKFEKIINSNGFYLNPKDCAVEVK